MKGEQSKNYKKSKRRARVKFEINIETEENEAAESSKKLSKRSRKKLPRDLLFWEVLERENEMWLDEKENSESLDNMDNLDNLDISEKLDETKVVIPVVEPSPDVTLSLLRFQKEWLAWALMQEASDIHGGILADEMGMGKTIQAISLVLSARGGDRSCSLSSSLAAADFPAVRCTLVICPVVALIQWVGEIEKYTRKGSAKVLVYHGAKRATVNHDFNDYDFVLTTYSTIEGDYRKYVMPPKEPCRYCGELFRPNRLKVHQRYYCGPYAKKTENQAKQLKKVKKSPNPRKRKKNVSEAKATPSIRGSVLHIVQWNRIILDEVISLNIYSKNLFIDLQIDAVHHLFFFERVPSFSYIVRFWLHCSQSLFMP